MTTIANVKGINNSGGIFYSNSVGTLNVTNSVISGNRSVYGGGIINKAARVNVTSTISIMGNLRRRRHYSKKSGTVNVTNNTISRLRLFREGGGELAKLAAC